MIPPPRQRGATVLVNGNARQFRVLGSPNWRTVIQVDGVTVYDKFPALYGKSTLKFDLIPGKPASLRWYKKTVQQLECEVTVDGATTTLASLAESAALKKSRKVFEQRVGGIFLLAVAAFSFYMNRKSLMDSDEYYPKSLAIIPLLVLGGLVNLVHPAILHPEVKPAPKNKVTQVVVGIVGVAIMAFGFTLFTDWFLAAFPRR